MSKRTNWKQKYLALEQEYMRIENRFEWFLIVAYFGLWVWMFNVWRNEW